MDNMQNTSEELLERIRQLEQENSVLKEHIKDCKKVKQVLHEIEERHRILFENANDAIFIANAQTGIIADANIKAEQLIGKPKNLIIGMHQTELHPIEQYADTNASFKKAIELSVQHHSFFHFNVFHSSGRIIPVEISTSCVEIEGKSYIYGIFRDNSKQSEIEQALKESEERFEAFMNYFPGAAFIKNSEGKLIFCNNLYASLLGVAPELLIGTTQSADDLPEELKKQYYEENEEVIAKGKTISSESSFPGPNGLSHWFTIKFPIESRYNQRLLGSISFDISERKKIDDELKQQFANISAILENTDDMICSRNKNHELLFFNKSYSNMIKKLFRVDAFVGMNVLEMMSEESRNYWKPIFNNVLCGEKYRGEFSWSFSNDETRFYDISFNPIVVDGEIIGYSEFNKDITETKTAEKALKESEERYSDLVLTLGEGIGIVNDKEEFVFCNPAASEIFEVANHELIGSNIGNFLDIEELNKIKQETAKRKKGEESKYELSIKTPTGKKKFIWLTAKPFFDTYGQFTGTFGVFSDITQRKIAEIELERSREMFHQLSESSGEMLLLSDLNSIYNYITEQLSKQFPESIILYISIDDEKSTATVKTIRGVNKSIISKVFELSGIELIGRTFKLLPNHRKLFRNTKLNCFKGGLSEFADSEFPKFAADALQKMLGINKIYTIGINKDDKLFGVIHFFTRNKTEIRETEYIETFVRQAGIIIEKKMLEMTLKESEQELTESLSEKIKFFSIISHDLRAPFSGFLGLSEVITKEWESLSINELREISISIHDSANKVYKLLNDLLLWSRSQSEGIPFNPSEVNLEEVINDNVYLLSKTAANKSIELITECGNNLVLQCDRNMITTIIRNLLDNAIKFSKHSSKITVKSFADKDSIITSVIDNGIGMDSTTISSLFSLGKKISNTGTAKEIGTGLGLMLCKEFIERHGGELIIDSEKGIGSTFTFTLPRIQQ